MLEGHHSRSSLPQAAKLLLVKMPAASPWECNCGRLNKGNATYCGTCGTPWWEALPEAGGTYQSPQVETPWRAAQHTWSNAPAPPSGGDRQRSLTPRGRRRAKAKGAGKGNGKGAGKPAGGKPTEGAGLTVPPLPPPPKAPAVTFPPVPSGPAPTSSAAEQHLGTLLSALQSQKSNLPPEVLQAIEGIAHNSAGQEARELHKAVSLQQKAKQELAKIGAQRLTACATWARYLQEVTATVQNQQLRLDDAEASWRQSLQGASTELAKLSEQRTEEEEDEMAVETANAWDALANARRQEQQAQQQQLMISLQQATETAASMANAAQRDNSRTSRRAKRPPPEGSSPELAPAGEGKDVPKGPDQEKLAATLSELSGKPSFS